MRTGLPNVFSGFATNTGEEVLHEGGWSSYDNLFRSSCDNCHGVRRKTSVYTTKTLVIFIVQTLRVLGAKLNFNDYASLTSCIIHVICQSLIHRPFSSSLASNLVVLSKMSKLLANSQILTVFFLVFIHAIHNYLIIT
jgi:hypothetical protein